MYEILDEAEQFSSGDKKRIYLEALILHAVNDEPNPLVRLELLGPLLTLCHRTLKEYDLRKYLTLMQIDLDDYWDPTRRAVTTWMACKMIHVIERYPNSLVDLDSSLYFEAANDPDLMALSTEIREAACLMHSFIE